MALRESTYIIPTRGLATSFAQTEYPPEYAQKYNNRFQNGAGGAEKRRGISQTGNVIPGLPTVTGITELIDRLGNSTTFAMAGGSVFRQDGNDWTNVFTFNTTSARIRSVAMSGKQIFYNAVDRPVYTPDGTDFIELKALIEVGDLAAGASARAVVDNDVDNWVTGTNVAINDVVFNVDLSAFAVITAVASAKLTHTAIGSAGAGGDGIGLVEGSVTTGQRYEIIDAVENNIIPTANPNDFDNEGTAGSGTNETSIKVSGATGTLNLSTLDIRVGDWVRNTTKSVLTAVTSVGTAIGVHGVSGQAADDALVFLKSAMPIIQDASVHYGRLYCIDARDLRKVRVSSPNNPQDFTSDGATLDLNDFPLNSSSIDKQTFDAGGLQPEADVLIAIRTFQRFLALIGKSKVYMYQGTEPVGSGADIQPIGLYPQGGVSDRGAVNLGNDFVYASPDGIKSIQLVQDAQTFSQSHLSNQLDVTLRDSIQANNGEDIQLVHYRKRSWLLCKIGAEIYLYNFAPVVLQGKQEQVIGSWHLFTGGFARQTAFYVKQDGTLMTGGAGGVVSEFDTNVFTDNGEVFETDVRTGWLNMKEPRTDVKLRQGHYLKPQMIAGGNIAYTFSVEAPYDAESTDSFVLNASGAASTIGLAVVGQSQIGGTGVINQKIPLHWKGEAARFRVRTEDALGPDILSRLTVYFNEKGRR